jgi:hypothetical protein
MHHRYEALPGVSSRFGADFSCSLEGNLLPTGQCTFLADGIYLKSVCVNAGSNGFLGGVIAQIDPKNGRVLRETHQDNNTPPSCDVNNAGLRTLRTRLAMTCGRDNGGRYGYSTCNSKLVTIGTAQIRLA